MSAAMFSTSFRQFSLRLCRQYSHASGRIGIIGAPFDKGQVCSWNIYHSNFHLLFPVGLLGQDDHQTRYMQCLLKQSLNINNNISWIKLLFYTISPLSISIITFNFNYQKKSGAASAPAALRESGLVTNLQDLGTIRLIINFIINLTYA